jgi:hypothetical protein
MAKKTNTVTATAQKATTTTTATLQVTNGKPLTYKCIWDFVNTHAQGQLANVQVVPLSNVKTGDAVPVPFGYNGKVGGVRATIQNWLLFGVKDAKQNNAHVALTHAKPLGHSYKSPICLLALLNGGYSPSSATWGTSFVKLVVKPQAS